MRTATLPMRLLGGIALLLALGVAHAEDLLMARSRQAFPEAMATLQEAISARGYTVSRVQHVDKGLSTFGFKTDLYRVVFFGKQDEVELLSRKYPQLIPYIPLPVAIFAEDRETLVVAANPAKYAAFFDAPELADVFRRWERDLQAIMDEVRAAD